MIDAFEKETIGPPEEDERGSEALRSKVSRAASVQLGSSWAAAALSGLVLAAELMPDPFLEQSVRLRLAGLLLLWLVAGRPLCAMLWLGDEEPPEPPEMSPLSPSPLSLRPTGMASHEHEQEEAERQRTLSRERAEQLRRVEERLETAEEQLASKDSQLKALAGTLQSRENELSRLEAQAAEAGRDERHQREELVQKHEALRAQLSVLETTTIPDMKADFERQRVAFEREHAQLQESFTEERQKVIMLEREKMSLITVLERMKKENDEWALTNENLIKENETHVNNAGAKDQLVEEHRKKLEAGHRQAEAELQRTIAGLERDLGGRERAYAELEQRHADQLEQARAGAAAAQAESVQLEEQLESERAELEAERAGRETERSQAQARVSRLEQGLVEAGELVQSKERQLEKANKGAQAEAQRRAEQLRRVEERLETAEEQLASKDSQLKALAGTLQSRENELSRLEAQAAEAGRDERHQREELVQKHEALRAQLSVLETTTIPDMKADFERQRAAFEREHGQLQESFTEERQKVIMLEREKMSLITVLERMKKENDEWALTNENLIKENQTHVNNAGAKDQLVEEHREKLEAGHRQAEAELQRTIAGLERDLGGRERAYAELKQRHADQSEQARAGAAAAQAESVQLEEQLESERAELEAERSGRETERSQAQARVSRLEQGLVEAGELVQSRERQLEKANKGAQAEAQRRAEQLRRVEERLETAEEQLASRDSQLEALAGTVQSRENELSRLEAQAAEARAGHGQVEAELKRTIAGLERDLGGRERAYAELKQAYSRFACTASSLEGDEDEGVDI